MEALASQLMKEDNLSNESSEHKFILTPLKKLDDNDISDIIQEKQMDEEMECVEVEKAGPKVIGLRDELL